MTRVKKIFLTKKGLVFFRKKNNNKCPPTPTRVFILVGKTLSRPVLHFYSSYRVDTKTNSNTRKGDNSKSKTTRAVILVCNTSSCPVLHFYEVYLFVCVEVLEPSQPNGVMSSTVNLPNHTFTGQV